MQQRRDTALTIPSNRLPVTLNVFNLIAKGLLGQDGAARDPSAFRSDGGRPLM